MPARLLGVSQLNIWSKKGGGSLDQELKHPLGTETIRRNVKLRDSSPLEQFFFLMLATNTQSSFQVNQKVYSHARSTAVVDHPSNLEKCQACILSHEIFITWGGETKDLPFNFSLFCLNQTTLAWLQGENWMLIQISMKMNYSSVPLFFIFWEKETVLLRREWGGMNHQLIII